MSTIEIFDGNQALTKMLDETNKSNTENLIKLMTHFHLDEESHDTVVKAIHNPPVPMEWLFGFNRHHRLVIPTTSTPQTDEGFKMYLELLTELPSLLRFHQELKTWDTWRTGQYQGQKLFRFLQKQGVPEDTLAVLASKRSTSAGTYIVISKNPMDWLFMSTDQSYTSCMSLESGYSNAVYFGMPFFMVAKYLMLVYTTTGKVRNYTTKGLDFKHFRYINRAIGIVGPEGSLNLVRYYPNNGDYDEILKDVLPIEVFPTDKYGYDSPRYAQPKLYLQNGTECVPYRDMGQYTYDNGDTAFTTSGGAYGCPMHLSWSGGFEKSSFKSLMQEMVSCRNCDEEIVREDARYHNDAWYCDDCFDEQFSYCDNCDCYVDNYYVMYVDHLNISVCDNCAEQYYFTCEGCNDIYHNNETHRCEYTNEYYCDDCWAENGGECESCAMILHHDHMEGELCPDCARDKRKELEALVSNLEELTEQLTAITKLLEDHENEKNELENEIIDTESEIADIQTSLGEI